MGFFDGIVDGTLKRGGDGAYLYFPHGRRKPGYALRDESQYIGLRRFYKTLFMIALPVIWVTVIYMPLWVTIVSLIAFTIWHRWFIGRLTKTLSVSAEPYTGAEFIGNAARSHNMAMLVALAVLAACFTLMGLLIV